MPARSRGLLVFFVIGSSGWTGTPFSNALQIVHQALALAVTYSWLVNPRGICPVSSDSRYHDRRKNNKRKPTYQDGALARRHSSRQDTGLSNPSAYSTFIRRERAIDPPYPPPPRASFFFVHSPRRCRSLRQRRSGFFALLNRSPSSGSTGRSGVSPRISANCL